MLKKLAQYPAKLSMTLGNIFAYAEDALTLWALKHRMDVILGESGDATAPADCFAFYRPSFGRRSGKGRAEFGEFDAIIVSSKNIYLIEGKWDGFSRNKRALITVRPEQKLRHHIFSWYIRHWNLKYANDWERFTEEYADAFRSEFPDRKIAPPESVLAKNIEYVLTTLKEYCSKSSCKPNIKNVLLFFYNGKRSGPPAITGNGFTLVPIDYSQEVKSNFIQL